jgi:hypothetical protein
MAATNKCTLLDAWSAPKSSGSGPAADPTRTRTLGRSAVTSKSRHLCTVLLVDERTCLFRWDASFQRVFSTDTVIGSFSVATHTDTVMYSYGQGDHFRFAELQSKSFFYTSKYTSVLQQKRKGYQTFMIETYLFLFYLFL